MDVVGLWLLGLLTLMLVLATALPISKVPLGAIRGLDFPRQQFFLLAVVLAAVSYVYVPGWLGGFGVPLLGLLAVIQLVYILKFTPLWPVQSVAIDKTDRQENRQVRLLAANIKLSNRDFDRFATLVKEKSPDIALLIEVDKDWIEAVNSRLGDAYPHRVEVPKSNGYGMAVLSRLPLHEVDVVEMVTRDVPSIRAAVSLPNNAVFRLYVIHPEPPVIESDTKGRDSEIALVGLEAANDEMPSIVAGDLNDVAWSTTTRRFQRLSGLLDPRVGRGFFNTFSATMPWMRWPLDHLFHDPRFRLVEMARLDKIGSDHFPMWFVLELMDNPSAATDPGESDASETMRAKRMIVEEKKRDRGPIGEDWEE